MRVFVIGAQRMQGRTEKGNEYDMMQVVYSVPGGDFKKDGFSLTTWGHAIPVDGSKKIRSLAFRPDLIPLLDKLSLSLPCLCDVVLQPSMDARGQLVQFVTDLKPVMAPVKVAA